MSQKIKYWSSSPRAVSPSGEVGPKQNLVLVTVTNPDQTSKTVQVASCPNGVISARIALALEQFEKGLV